MAVTITTDDLRAALRLGNTNEETRELERIRSYAIVAVLRYAPGAPDVAHDEAVVRLSAYLFDQPTVSRGDAYANALRSSGAARMLVPYRIHRAGSTAEAVAEAQAAAPAGNPVTNVTVAGAELLVTFADGTIDTHALTAVDQTARDTANAAGAAAMARTTPAEAATAARGVTADWAEVANTEQIPLDKLGNVPSVGGIRVYIQTGEPTPSAAPANSVWIRDLADPNNAGEHNVTFHSLSGVGALASWQAQFSWSTFDETGSGGAGTPVALVALVTDSTNAVNGTATAFNAVRLALNGTTYRALRVVGEYPRTFGTITNGRGFTQAQWEIPAGLNVPAASNSDTYIREFGGTASDQSGAAEVLTILVRPGGTNKLTVQHKLPEASTLTIYGVP